MKLFKKANDAIDLVKDCLDNLLTRKTELETIITEKNRDINRLMSLAVSLNDFCEYIPHFVKEYGKDEFRLMVTNVRQGSYGRHALSNINSETKDRHLSLRNFEDEKGNIDASGLLTGMAGGIYNETGTAVMKKLCFFFPDVISEKLIEVFKESNIEWGYEDNIPVAERRIKIAELVAQRSEAQSELDDVTGEIERIERLTDAIPKTPVPAEESIYGLRKGANGEIIDVRPGENGAFATIS